MPPGVFVQIGVADAGGDHANAHFAGARLFLLQLDEFGSGSAVSGKCGGDFHAPGAPM